jgi:hypothetical protein
MLRVAEVAFHAIELFGASQVSGTLAKLLLLPPFFLHGATLRLQLLCARVCTGM